MLDIDYIFSKYGIPKGIIHIAGQFIYVRSVYYNWGLSNILWIEPNPFFYDLNLQYISQSENEKLLNYNIDSQNRDTFITYNINSDSQQRRIESKKLTNIIDDISIDRNNYDFLNIGPQVNTNSLEGCEEELSLFKFICVDVTQNVESNYSDLKFIDNYLKKFRFKRVELVIQNNIGQAFYIKKRKYTKKL